ncbi:MAG: molybdate ABC transporter permease subunit [Kiritimatiellae bacterium]|nr:molybdate ABC transporter permease subunit [Kiritimatiellia bacterium]MCO5062629.1 molybdate ABC transporter permease subunit [Kiritimatiellia bacterium]MCO5068539.1 molybdate ABC transporter permease subunit [Kiritimatiellia bacterium]MCO6401791.1 molybdate ABC transporter permease subunit [Verrucomicrobiota bacterium]
MTPEEWNITLFTAGIAGLSTLCILPLGLLTAWWLAKFDWPGKSILETFLSLPLVMPPVATGLILLELLGRRGWIGGWLHRVFDLDIAFTWRAVLIATASMSFPLLVRALRTGFEEVSQEYEDAARVEGAGGCQLLWHVTLPLSRRSLAAGLIQAYARALGEFGATIMLAGNIPGKTTTLSLAIYQHVQMGRDATAYRLLLVSVIMAFVAIWVSEHFQRPKRARRQASSSAR